MRPVKKHITFSNLDNPYKSRKHVYVELTVLSGVM